MPALFTYGTLMSPEILSLVIDRNAPFTAATLDGYRRGCLTGRTFPAIVPDPNHIVQGILYTDISIEEFERLDLFEGELYLRQQVKLNFPVETESYTYVLAQAYQHLLSLEEWSYDSFLTRHKEQFISSYTGWSRK